MAPFEFGTKSRRDIDCEIYGRWFWRRRIREINDAIFSSSTVASLIHLVNTTRKQQS